MKLNIEYKYSLKEMDGITVLVWKTPYDNLNATKMIFILALSPINLYTKLSPHYNLRTLSSTVLWISRQKNST